MLLQDLPHLFALNIRRIFDLYVASLGNDLLWGERPLRGPPSGILPPLLDRLDLFPVFLVLLIERGHDADELERLELTCKRRK